MDKIKKLVKEKLCKKGEAYRKRRMAAGEKSSAYLSGRAVKVCKGQMSGKKKKQMKIQLLIMMENLLLMDQDIKELNRKIAESLRDWFKKENWVRINTSGNISGDCGTMKKGKATTRCLPKKKAQSMTKAERKATVAKKVRGSKKGKQFVSVNEQMDIYDDVANMEFGMDYDQLGSNEKEWVRDEIDNMSIDEAMVNYDFSKKELIRVIKQLKRGASTEVGMIKAFEKALGRELTDDEIRGFKLNEVTRYSGFNRNPEDPDSEKFEPTGSVAQFKEELRALFGKFKGDLRNPEFIKGVAQIMNNWKPLLRSQLNENFEMGDRVKLTPDYEETPGEVFTITQISGNRYFIADEDGRGWYTYGQDLVMADDELNESTHPYENKGNIRIFSKDVDPTSLVWHSDKEDRLIEVLEGEGWKLQLDNKLPLLLSKGDRIFINEGDIHRIHKGITDLKIKIN